MTLSLITLISYTNKETGYSYKSSIKNLKVCMPQKDKKRK